MKTLQEQIIAKQDELIEFYELLFDGDTTQHIHEAKLKKELSALEQQAAQELLNIPNNSQIRNNPTKDLYEMVYVESEADLPKEEGWYICSGKGQLRKYYWRNGESDIWIISNRIDWYLRPLEAEQPSNNRQQSKDSANNLKTAEEILKGEMSENLWTFICSYPVSYKSEEKLVEWIIDAMQEYAAQFKAEQEKVTDDVLRTELKRFNDWMCGNQFDGRIPLIDQCIHEYMEYRSTHNK